jgi:hypothetical protein
MDYKKLSINKLKEIIQKGVPAEQRMAAIELYERGEKDYAVNFLIEQMNLYKDPETHENIKRETCTTTAVVLGRLQDERAIEPLFEALGELGNLAAAYALAKINGQEIEERLLNLVTLENRKGIHALIALALMKNEKIVPIFIELLEHIKDYEKKYTRNISMEWVDKYTLIKIIGSYVNNKLAEDTFKKLLSKSDIESILHGFVQEERCRYSYVRSFLNELGWQITKKYGWDKYLDTDEKRYAFTYTNPEKWVENLRNEIVEKIWQIIKGYE